MTWGTRILGVLCSPSQDLLFTLVTPFVCQWLPLMRDTDPLLWCQRQCVQSMKALSGAGELDGGGEGWDPHFLSY